MADMLTPVLVIAGPTATGKTAAAVALARRFDGELIGADSVQVYRGFDIGSAKPTEAELQGVPHHLINIVDPDERAHSEIQTGVQGKEDKVHAHHGSQGYRVAEASPWNVHRSPVQP